MRSWTTSRLNPSDLLGELNLYGGTLALPVPKFHCIEVSTYPLKVVDASAVVTELGFSSAGAVDARLTTPKAANAIVHFSNFISSSDLCSVQLLSLLHLCEGKTGLPSHQNQCIRRFDS